MLTDAEYYSDAKHYSNAIAPQSLAIRYTDPKPRPFEIKISLVEYFERVTGHKADRWQVHFCEYLQNAAANRHVKPTKAIVHAQARLGKSRILAQCYSAWLLGHDPLHRIALATYNIEQSKGHSGSVIAIMNLPIHKAIFPDERGWVGENVAKDKWRTNARRRDVTDTEQSFKAVGLQSGLTGSGFDTLIIDDPYADAQEAFSPAVRKSLTNHFWEFTVTSRIGEHSNVFGMFHRYHVEDLAGYLLDKGTFDYLRYASVCDGPYIHRKTGQKFDDPLGREIGEYISERFGDAYYADKKLNPQVWASMFQGVPVTEQGQFFQVNKMIKVSGAELAAEREKCVLWIRAYDSASTAGGGDHSAAAKIGMQPDGGILIDDLKLAQVDSAGYAKLQEDTAKEDGLLVPICIPKPLADTGSHIVFHTQQFLKGYTVIPRSVAADSTQIGSTAKHRRAFNLAGVVNSSQVKYASDEHLPEDKKWNETLIECMRNFGFTDFDDPIDACADGYNELFEQLSRGLVINNFRPLRNLIIAHQFAARFPAKQNGHAPKLVPDNFTIYAGVKITGDATQANSAAIVARAPEIADMPDKLFLVAEYKEWTGDMYLCFDWLNESLDKYCENSKAATVWLHPDSETYLTTIRQKLKARNVALFDGDGVAGLTELDWYMLPTDNSSPFHVGQKDTRFYGILHDAQQLAVPLNGSGLVAFRQESATWGRDDNGQPDKLGGVADCVRMITYAFRTRSVPMTVTELAQREVAKIYTPEIMAAVPVEDKGELQTFKRLHFEKKKEEIAQEKEAKPVWADL